MTKLKGVINNRHIQNYRGVQVSFQTRVYISLIAMFTHYTINSTILDSYC